MSRPLPSTTCLTSLLGHSDVNVPQQPSKTIQNARTTVAPLPLTHPTQVIMMRTSHACQPQKYGEPRHQCNDLHTKQIKLANIQPTLFDPPPQKKRVSSLATCSAVSKTTGLWVNKEEDEAAPCARRPRPPSPPRLSLVRSLAPPPPLLFAAPPRLLLRGGLRGLEELLWWGSPRLPRPMLAAAALARPRSSGEGGTMLRSRSRESRRFRLLFSASPRVRVGVPMVEEARPWQKLRMMDSSLMRHAAKCLSFCGRGGLIQSMWYLFFFSPSVGVWFGYSDLRNSRGYRTETT